MKFLSKVNIFEIILYSLCNNHDIKDDFLSKMLWWMPDVMKYFYFIKANNLILFVFITRRVDTNYPGASLWSYAHSSVCMLRKEGPRPTFTSSRAAKDVLSWHRMVCSGAGAASAHSPHHMGSHDHHFHCTQWCNVFYCHIP